MIGNIAYLIRMMALAFLGATATLCAANAESVDDLLQKQRMQQQKQTDQIVKLTGPLIERVKKRAHTYELYSSPETADVAARAAVGFCSKEESAYRQALFQLAIIMTSFDANGRAQQTHDQLVERALTIIVGERQHQRTEQAKNETNTQQFKRGCSDFVAGRMTKDALNCVSVLNTALELVVIFQAEGGTKGLNICITKDTAHPRLVQDYVKLVNQRPDLMDDDQPVSIGLIRILAREFPCAKE